LGKEITLSGELGLSKSLVSLTLAPILSSENYQSETSTQEHGSCYSFWAEQLQQAAGSESIYILHKISGTLNKSKTMESLTHSYITLLQLLMENYPNRLFGK
jgi:hypothetical protein